MKPTFDGIQYLQENDFVSVFLNQPDDLENSGSAVYLNSKPIQEKLRETRFLVPIRKVEILPLHDKDPISKNIYAKLKKQFV